MYSIKVTGIDDAIRVADMAGKLLLEYTINDLTWFGEECKKRMLEYHPPGGPHPPKGELPVYGKHRYIDRTGQLSGSIGFKVTPWQARQAVVAVFALAPYASTVEHGHPRARPYPFFWPTFYEFLPHLMIKLQQSAILSFTDARGQVQVA